MAALETGTPLGRALAAVTGRTIAEAGEDLMHEDAVFRFTDGAELRVEIHNWADPILAAELREPE